MLKKSIGNGGSKKAGEMLAEFERVQAAHKAIEAMGVVLKDPDVGLLDFLHRRPDGREVYLCWRYGEAGGGLLARAARRICGAQAGVTGLHAAFTG